MSRPVEYENLIRTRALEEVPPTLGAIDGFLQQAEQYKDAAKATSPTMRLPKFTMAYEGYFQLVQAVLEFYTVRTKESGRNLAILRVSSSLGLSTAEFEFIGKAHSRRNGTSYSSPFPPVTKAEADAMLEILEKYLPIARALTSAT